MHIPEYNVLYIIDSKGKVSPDNLPYVISMLLSNDGVDMDRLDFLLRDIYHTGRSVEERDTNGYHIKGLNLHFNPHDLEQRMQFVDTLLSHLDLTEVENLPQNERNKFSGDFTGKILCFKYDEDIIKCLDDFFKFIQRCII